MKKIFLFIELLLIFTFLIIPPLIVTTNNGPQLNCISYFVLFQIVLCIFLQYQEYFLDLFFENKIKQSLKNNLKWIFITFSLLLAIFCILEFVNFIFLKTTNNETNNIFPLKNKIEILIIIINLLSSALYEEIIYRQFLPNTLQILFNTNKNKIIFYFIEILSILIFSFSHKYLGLFSVVNAFFCGIILRLCYLKTKTIYTGFIAHFLYNSTMVILSASLYR